MNPFVQNIRLNVIQINGSYTVIDNSKGNSSNDDSNKLEFKIPKSYLVEQMGKTGIFHVPNIKHILFRELKSIGRDLLHYIEISLTKNFDYIKLVPSSVCEEMNISRAGLYVAINQLTQAGIITKRDVKTYWINPLYIFNGNRIEYFQALDGDHINIVAQL